jgi:hypothetical protein
MCRKHVAHGAGDHRAFTAKQLGHLDLIQPDSVIGLADISQVAAGIGLRSQQHVDTDAHPFLQPRGHEQAQGAGLIRGHADG